MGVHCLCAQFFFKHVLAISLDSQMRQLHCGSHHGNSKGARSKRHFQQPITNNVTLAICAEFDFSTYYSAGICYTKNIEINRANLA